MLTSPPPTTRTFLSLTCQATIIDPPPWTSGNFCAMMSYIHLIIENRRLDVRMHYSIIGPGGGVSVRQPTGTEDDVSFF